MHIKVIESNDETANCNELFRNRCTKSGFDLFETIANTGKTDLEYFQEKTSVGNDFNKKSLNLNSYFLANTKIM